MSYRGKGGKAPGKPVYSSSHGSGTQRAGRLVVGGSALAMLPLIVKEGVELKESGASD
jgi:hypothetical protein